MSRPRVLLADDHTLLVAAFQRFLADDCEVVGTVSNGRELLEAVARLRPDVAIIDVAMPLLNGIDAARQLKHDHPDLRIIVLTMNEDPELAAAAFKAGASGYLLKRSAADELVTAIREVMQQRSYVTPLATAGLVASLREPRGDGPVALTPRQREVLQLVAEGRSLKEVAAILDISPRTAAFHKYKIMEVLHAKTTADLVRYAVKHHVV